MIIFHSSKSLLDFRVAIKIEMIMICILETKKNRRSNNKDHFDIAL